MTERVTISAAAWRELYGPTPPPPPVRHRPDYALLLFIPLGLLLSAGFAMSMSLIWGWL
jgi:hypothetical protein